MKVKFWGVRGSTPSPMLSLQIRGKIARTFDTIRAEGPSDPSEVEKLLEKLPIHLVSTFGGNTSCVELSSGDDFIVFDAGSALRFLGMELMERGFASGGKILNLILSHTHWDHIMGFPFFGPAYVPGNTIIFHGVHERLEERMKSQQGRWHFPAKMEEMGADFSFVKLEEGVASYVGSFKITPIGLRHPGRSYAYKAEKEGKSVVYATDAAYGNSDNLPEKYIDFYRNADLLIFDAQFSVKDAIEKEDWGHSSAPIGLALAQRASVKRLALFHHDPNADDKSIVNTLNDTIKRRDLSPTETHRPEILAAYEGMEIGI